MLGRAADDIKGIVYAIKSISLIVKEIPDVNLILLSSSNKIDHLKAYAKKLGVDRNINFNLLIIIHKIFQKYFGILQF